MGANPKNPKAAYMRGRSRAPWAFEETPRWRVEGPWWTAEKMSYHLIHLRIRRFPPGWPAGQWPSGAFAGGRPGEVVFQIWIHRGQWWTDHPLEEPWMRLVQAALTQLGAAFLKEASHASGGGASEAKSDAQDVPPPEAAVAASDPPRPKGTEEAHPGTSFEANDVHGGDSASGEVPDAASGGGEAACSRAQRGETSPRAGQSSSGGGDYPGGGLGSSAPEAGAEALECASPDTVLADNASWDAPASQEEATGGDPPFPKEAARLEEFEAALFGEMGARESDEDTVPSPGGALGAEAPEPDEKGNIRLFRLPRVGHGPAAFSTHFHIAHGGVYARLRDQGPPSPQVVARLRAILARLRLGGETEEGPRLEGKKVARKVAGYLRPITMRDHRIEEGRPAFLVLPDVSGSMSAVAKQVAIAGLTLARTGAPGWDVIVVIHSNGYPEEMVVNNGRPDVLSDFSDFQNPEDAIRWYEKILRRYSVRAVLACADWGGEWLYRWLAHQPSVEIFLWLDPWSHRRMRPRWVPFPPRRVGRLGAWAEFALRKVRYAFAVGDVEEVVELLERLNI